MTDYEFYELLERVNIQDDVIEVLTDRIRALEDDVKRLELKNIKVV